MTNAYHFIGFKDDAYLRAQKVFGQPDFIHRHYDHRAVSEIMPGDVAVFACDSNFIQPHAYDDSARF